MSTLGDFHSVPPPADCPYPCCSHCLIPCHRPNNPQLEHNKVLDNVVKQWVLLKFGWKVVSVDSIKGKTYTVDHSGTKIFHSAAHLNNLPYDYCCCCSHLLLDCATLIDVPTAPLILILQQNTYMLFSKSWLLFFLIQRPWTMPPITTRRSQIRQKPSYFKFAVYLIVKVLFFWFWKIWFFIYENILNLLYGAAITAWRSWRWLMDITISVTYILYM